MFYAENEGARIRKGTILIPATPIPAVRFARNKIGEVSETGDQQSDNTPQTFRIATLRL